LSAALNQSNSSSELDSKSPLEIIEWTVSQYQRPLVTTSFGPFSAVMLHLATQVKPDIQIGWVDSGYNTDDTYRYAENLIQTLNLNIAINTPAMTRARREATSGGIPELDTDQHKAFTSQIKLEPFQQLLDELKPDVWLTAVRADETEYRSELDIVSDGPDGIIKVSPFLNWTEVDMEGYLYENDLPQNDNYFDPTKGEEDRECGLHTMHEEVYMGEGI
jgi:phosphoadenosine phosphosulfate reductase